ncbi:hypothetical protein [Peribacillus frigoritolerans]
MDNRVIYVILLAFVIIAYFYINHTSILDKEEPPTHILDTERENK